jgi:hypothetical protein
MPGVPRLESPSSPRFQRVSNSQDRRSAEANTVGDAAELHCEPTTAAVGGRNMSDLPGGGCGRCRAERRITAMLGATGHRTAPRRRRLEVVKIFSRRSPGDGRHEESDGRDDGRAATAVDMVNERCCRASLAPRCVRLRRQAFIRAATSYRLTAARRPGVSVAGIVEKTSSPRR